MPSPSPCSPACLLPWSPLRILIIDDNLADQYLLREAAETLGVPVALTFAMDGDHGFAILAHLLSRCPDELPQLILLDLHLPGLSGLEVLERLKTHESLAVIPVVMLTTSSLIEDARVAYRRRANAFMTKHPNFEVFRRQFQTMISFWHDAAPPPTPRR